MAAATPSAFTFTSDTVRIITLDSSVFPSCPVNDGGNISTVDFSQLYNYVTQSDGYFYIEDLTVSFDVINFSARFYQKPQNYMPLSALPVGYSYVNGVFTVPDISSGGSSVSVDLNPVYTAINNAVDLIGSFISNKGDEIVNNLPQIDTASIEASLQTIKGYTDTVESELSIIESRITSNPALSVSISSLNGNGCEHLDGIDVTVNGRDTIYSITRSFHTIYADNAYIVCYDLESTDGHKLTCPESLLTKYVAPVVTAP